MHACCHSKFSHVFLPRDLSISGALLQQVCLEILELTANFTQELRSDNNSQEDRKHATQMYVDVVAIAKRTKDAQEHCNAHLEAMVSSCTVERALVCGGLCVPACIARVVAFLFICDRLFGHLCCTCAPVRQMSYSVNSSCSLLHKSLFVYRPTQDARVPVLSTTKGVYTAESFTVIAKLDSVATFCC